MNRLWVQLTLAFSMVVVIAVAVIAVVLNSQIQVHFRRFVEQFPQEYVVSRLTRYYDVYQTWEGVERLFPGGAGNDPPRPAGPPGGSGGPPGPPRPDQQDTGSGGRRVQAIPPFTLADADGYIVYETHDRRVGEYLNQGELGDSIPVVWNDTTVGYVFVVPAEQIALPPGAQSFLESVNRILVQVGVGAIVFGVVMALVIARGLSLPLARLEAAARHLSRGRLDERVTTTGTAEVASVAGAFNEMAHNLQQARQVQQNMVADVAHELRTPLSVIQGNLQAILEDVYPLDKQEVATIYDETLVLGRLVNDLHELAQAEAGQLRLSMEPVFVVPLVGRTTALFGELATEKGITLDVTLPEEEVAPVRADMGRVQQILNNFLSNALRYTPACGTIAVTVQPSDGAGGRYTRISVIDSGPGIPPQNLSSVFERFWRADAGRSRDMGGSGLGLAISRQLVEAQGGQIGVSSEMGAGSHFWFTLPHYDQSV